MSPSSSHMHSRMSFVSRLEIKCITWSLSLRKRPVQIQKPSRSRWVSVTFLPPGGIVYLLRMSTYQVSSSSIAPPWWDIMESLQTLQAWYPTLLLPSHTSSQVRFVSITSTLSLTNDFIRTKCTSGIADAPCWTNPDIYRLSAMEVLSLINETSFFICVLICRYNWRKLGLGSMDVLQLIWQCIRRFRRNSDAFVYKSGYYCRVVEAILFKGVRISNVKDYIWQAPNTSPIPEIMTRVVHLSALDTLLRVDTNVIT